VLATGERVHLWNAAVWRAILLCMVFFSSLSAQQSKLRIFQTNSAADNIHIIDPATNKVRLGLLLPTANFLLPAR
jgi:hypothetical protein